MLGYTWDKEWIWLMSPCFHLILEDGKITEFEIDFSKEFEKWKDPATGAVKKILPVTHKGEAKVL